MTAIDILKKDHRKVDDLFTQIESDGSDKKQIFGQIYNELTLHSQAEETFFYPELELSSETSGDVQHSYKEHQQVKDMLEDLASSDPNAAVWMTRLNELKESVRITSTRKRASSSRSPSRCSGSRSSRRSVARSSSSRRRPRRDSARPDGYPAAY